MELRSELFSNGGSDAQLSSPMHNFVPVIDYNTAKTTAMALEEKPKRKRGRPRKYQDDTTSTGGGGTPLAVSPLNTYSAAFVSESNSGGGGEQPKKGRGRPRGSLNKKKHVNMIDSGSAEEVGFTTHVITVEAGEDMYSKIMSFSQNCPRAVCILSANGALSNVTLHQADTSGGTVTYEGRYEILTLSGSFTITDNGGQRSRTGGLSVSLAGPDGRILGGGVAGLLTAATPIQVIVGSFKADENREMKHFSYTDTPTTAPSKLTPVRMTGIDSPSSQGIFVSGGSGCQHNQNTGIYSNQHQQTLPNIPWKQG